MMWVAMFLSHHPILWYPFVWGCHCWVLNPDHCLGSALTTLPPRLHIYIYFFMLEFDCLEPSIYSVTHRNATLRSTFLSILSSHFNQSFSLASLPSTFPTNMIFSKRRTLTTGLTNPVVNVAVGVWCVTTSQILWCNIGGRMVSSLPRHISFPRQVLENI